MWMAAPGNIKKGTGCPYCVGLAKPTTEEYKEQIKNKPFEVLEEYKGSLTKIKHQCHTCDYIWNVKPNQIKNGHGCPGCSNEQRYKNNPTWLYYIFIPSKNLYKIGVARKGTLNRYKRETFDIEIIQEELFEDGYEAYKLEQKIIQANKQHAWSPSKEEKFVGWTECFTENIKESYDY